MQQHRCRTLLLALALCAHTSSSVPDAAACDKVENQIKETRQKILAEYGPDATAELFGLGVEFLAGDAARGRVVHRLARAFALSDSFVVAVGGMSDVAGHGNMFEEAYPNVCGDALRDVFLEAGVRFQVRNMAMGGVPSFPNSVCMADNFGADADVVVWDFRMVERDPPKGELYVRQAMMLPRAPFVVFKRKNGYLNNLKYAHEDAAITVIDEMKGYNKLKKLGSPGVTQDRFCATKCGCPGQVKWHAGYKAQRFRGHHMALHYLDLFEEAVRSHRALLAAGVPAADAAHWALEPRPALPKPVNKEVKPLFGSRTFHCGMTWRPKVGRSLTDLVDPQLGLNGWRLQHPNPRVADITAKGHGECHYRDEKRSLVGNAQSHWVFFNLQGVADDGMIAFCGDFKSREFGDYALIVVNQEEVMGELTPWLESKTLGISSACFSTTHNVVEGENVVGFRVTSGELSISLTHLIWT